jgi:hypothetical protein
MWSKMCAEVLMRLDADSPVELGKDEFLRPVVRGNSNEGNLHGLREKLDSARPVRRLASHMSLELG